MCTKKPCDLPVYADGMCRNDYMTAWRRRLTPEQRDLIDLKCKARAYGLNANEIAAHFEEHSGLCDICGEPPCNQKRRLSIDHDHETGKFRGLLCDACNNGLGRFKDDPKLLLSAIDYLERNM